MEQKISDDELKQALSLFRDSVHQFRSTGECSPSRSFTGWRAAFAAFAMILILLAAIVPLYRQHQAPVANAANVVTAPNDDDALLRAVESEVARSVPPPMQPLELLMASDTTASPITSERSK